MEPILGQTDLIEVPACTFEKASVPNLLGSQAAASGPVQRFRVWLVYWIPSETPGPVSICPPQERLALKL